MDITAYVQHRGSEGCREAIALFEWHHLAIEGKVVCQGEGANLQRWIPKQNPSFRDVTTYMAGACTEGRHTIRYDPDNGNNTLMESVHSSATSFEHVFLKGGVPALEVVPHSSPTNNGRGVLVAHHIGDEPIGKQRRTNNLAKEAPQAFERCKKKCAQVQQCIAYTLSNAQEIVQFAQANVDAVRGDAAFKCDQQTSEASVGCVQLFSEPIPDTPPGDTQRAASSSSMSIPHNAQTKDVRRTLNAGGLAAHMLHRPGGIMCVAHMELPAKDLVNCATVEAYASQLTAWHSAVECAEQLTRGLQQASHSLRGHVENATKKRMTQAQAEATEKEKQDRLETLKKAKEAADKVKHKASDNNPIYSVVCSSHASMTRIDAKGCDKLDVLVFDVDPPQLFRATTIKHVFGANNASYSPMQFRWQLQNAAALQRAPADSKRHALLRWKGGVRCHRCRCDCSCEWSLYADSEGIPHSLKGSLTSTWLSGYVNTFKNIEPTPNGLAMLNILCR